MKKKEQLLIVSEEEYISNSKRIIEAKRGNTAYTEIVVIPEWIVDAIRAGRIK